MIEYIFCKKPVRKYELLRLVRTAGFVEFSATLRRLKCWKWSNCFKVNAILSWRIGGGLSLIKFKNIKHQRKLLLKSNAKLMSPVSVKSWIDKNFVFRRFQRTRPGSASNVRVLFSPFRWRNILYVGWFRIVVRHFRWWFYYCSANIHCKQATSLNLSACLVLYIFMKTTYDQILSNNYPYTWQIIAQIKMVTKRSGNFTK